MVKNSFKEKNIFSLVIKNLVILISYCIILIFIDRNIFDNIILVYIFVWVVVALIIIIDKTINYYIDRLNKNSVYKFIYYKFKLPFIIIISSLGMFINIHLLFLIFITLLTKSIIDYIKSIYELNLYKYLLNMFTIPFILGSVLIIALNSLSVFHGQELVTFNLKQVIIFLIISLIISILGKTISDHMKSCNKISFIKLSIKNLTMPIIISVIAIKMIYTHQTNGITFDVLSVTIIIYMIAILITLIVKTITNNLLNLKDLSNIFSKKLIIPFILGTVLIIFLNQFSPSFSSDKFYLKHIAIFTIITILVILFGKTINDYIYTKFKIKYIKYFILIMIILTLTILSQLQINYLKNYVIPPLWGCSYYDKSNNLIYSTQFVGNCPNLENITENADENGSELSFSVNESKFYKVIEANYTLKTNIEYKYDSLNRVIEYNITKIKKLYTIKGELDELWYYHKNIQNIYEDKKVTSIHTVYNENKNRDFANVGNSTPTIIEIISELYDGNEIDKKYNNQELDYYIDIKYRNLKEQDYTKLYEIYITSNFDEPMYIIKEPENDEKLIIARNYNEISRNYITGEAFNLCHSIFNDRFFIKRKVLNTYNIPLLCLQEGNEFKEVYTDTYSDTNKQKIGFVKNINQFTKTDYGYFIKHYLYVHEGFSNKLLDVNTLPGYYADGLFIEINSINDYQKAIFDIDFYRFSEYVYQKNPLLFEDYVIGEFKKNK